MRLLLTEGQVRHERLVALRAQVRTERLILQGDPLGMAMPTRRRVRYVRRQGVAAVVRKPLTNDAFSAAVSSIESARNVP